MVGEACTEDFSPCGNVFSIGVTAQIPCIIVRFIVPTHYYPESVEDSGSLLPQEFRVIRKFLMMINQFSKVLDSAEYSSMTFFPAVAS